MDSVLMSRIKKDVSPTKLQNLSPDKYGKAAWAELTYTPSKLADNIIFREAVTLKKTEEGSSKLRQLQAMNGFIKERLTQLQHERDGIQKSLTQQINMYKKMLHESDSKNQARLLEIQKRFNSQISILISQKEEEAKFAQAQQQLLEDRIAELQQKLRQSEERQANLNFDHGTLKNNFQKLTIEYGHLKQNLAKSQKQRANDQAQWLNERQNTKLKMNQLERNYHIQIENVLKDKVKEKESMERLMKTEIEKLENIRVSESLRKAQEIRDVMLTFENQTKRLNEIIAMKDRMLQSLTYQNTKNKQNIIQITATYQSRISNLTNDRNDLSLQIQNKINHIAELQAELQRTEANRAQERERLGQVILELKDELQHNQIYYLREKDQLSYWGADLEKENIMLRSENKRIADIMSENDRLSAELRNLRDLLVQSSFEIQRSKEELMRMAFERETLGMKIQKVTAQKERLYRLNNEVKEEPQWMRSQYYNPHRMTFR